MPASNTPDQPEETGARPAATSAEKVALVDPDDVAAREQRARRLRLRMLLAIAVVASAVTLTAIGIGTYSAVERSLHEMRATTLMSILDTQSKTIDVWIQDQMVTAHRTANNRLVRRQVAELVAIAVRSGADPEQYCAEPMRRPLVRELDEALAGTGSVRFNIVDSAGRVVASRVPRFCGLSVRPEWLTRELGPVLGGDTTFTPPSRDEDWFEHLPTDGVPSRPLVWISIPVFADDGSIIAALSIGHYAHEQFAAILAAVRGGRTLEAYAFDRHGNRLSRSRFADDELADDTGALDDAASRWAFTPPRDATGRLTQLIGEALSSASGGDGLLVEPYPGYYGRDVIGAWRWLPDYDMGIAVEIAAVEAYAPLRTLWYAFAGVFAALVLAVVAVLVSWYRAARQRIGEKQRLGPYVLVEKIGEGGVGNVYLANHDLLKRPTAVKLLKPSRSSDEMVERFKREVQLASQLSHPNMVEIFDYGYTASGTLYYAMEYLEGVTIGDLVLRGGAMPVARAAHLLLQVCAGLAEAHGKGLVHRDISATNIMVCHYGGQYDFVKILDFGLVKSLTRADTQTITRTMRLLGTPLYMAPERLRDPSDVDFRSDIYSVGVVAFFILTGRKMFQTDDTLALTSCVLHEVPPRVSAVATQPIPEELDLLIESCLHKRREDRPQRITDMVDTLESISRTHRWTQSDAEAAWVHAGEEDPGRARASS